MGGYGDLIVSYPTHRRPTKTPLFGDETNERHQQELQQSEAFVQANDERLEVLGERIAAIREISVEIHRESQLSTELMKQMEAGMTGASGALKAAMKKIADLTEQTTYRHMIYLMLFLVFALFVLYRIFSGRG